MIKQYTRFYYNPAGEVTYCHSQLTPLEDGMQPIISGDPTETDVYVDCEIECDHVDRNFGHRQECTRAKDLIAAFEIENGAPKVKANATARLKKAILAVGAPKDIQETAIRNEKLTEVSAALEASGSSMQEAVAILKTKRPDIESEDDLSVVALIRMAKKLAR